eukprot:1158906-Pelagomonas_calceolata.AAC.1
MGSASCKACVISVFYLGVVAHCIGSKRAGLVTESPPLVHPFYGDEVGTAWCFQCAHAPLLIACREIACALCIFDDFFAIEAKKDKICSFHLRTCLEAFLKAKTYCVVEDAPPSGHGGLTELFCGNPFLSNGKAATLCTIPLGVDGTCCKEHKSVKTLGLDYQRASKLARKLHARYARI